MKTVFDNRQLAHVWAQQNQDSGRSKSMSFYKQTIYSYATPIARFYPGNIVLITSQTFSPTTSSKHMPALHSAVRHLTTFHVPYVFTDTPDGYNGAHDSIGRGNGVGTHADNLTFLKDQYDSYKAKLLKKRDAPASYDYERLHTLYDNCTQYAALFNLTMNYPRYPFRDSAEIAQHHIAKAACNNSPATIAKREKEKAARNARILKIAAEIDSKFAKNIAEWKTGYKQLLPYHATRTINNGAYLRIKGENVETSLGATVPVIDAKRVIPLIRAQKETGKPRDLVASRVGHFTIDKIAANGDINAGCHFIEFAEIDRIGQQLGV